LQWHSKPPKIERPKVNKVSFVTTMARWRFGNQIRTGEIEAQGELALSSGAWVAAGGTITTSRSSFSLAVAVAGAVGALALAASPLEAAAVAVAAGLELILALESELELSLVLASGIRFCWKFEFQFRVWLQGLSAESAGALASPVVAERGGRPEEEFRQGMELSESFDGPVVVGLALEELWGWLGLGWIGLFRRPTVVKPPWLAFVEAWPLAWTVSSWWSWRANCLSLVSWALSAWTSSLANSWSFDCWVTTSANHKSHPMFSKWSALIS